MEEQMKKLQLHKLAGHLLYPSTAFPPVLKNLGQVQGYEKWPSHVLAQYGGPYPAACITQQLESKVLSASVESKPTMDELQSRLRTLEEEAKIKTRLTHFVNRLVKKLAFLGQLTEEEMEAAETFGIPIPINCIKAETVDTGTLTDTAAANLVSKACQIPSALPIQASTVSLFRCSGLTNEASTEDLALPDVKEDGTGENYVPGTESIVSFYNGSTQTDDEFEAKFGCDDSSVGDDFASDGDSSVIIGYDDV